MRKILSWAIIIVAFFICSNAYAGSQQTSGVTAQVIIDRARFFLDNTTSIPWTDANLLFLVNYGTMDIIARTKALESTENISLSTGVSEYAITSNYLSIEKAIYSGVTVKYNNNPYKGLLRIDIRDVAHKQNVGVPVRYYTWNDTIGFDPMPDAGVSIYSVLLYLVTRPTDRTITGGTSVIQTPAMYDLALTYFVVSKAFKKIHQLALSKDYWDEYIAQLAQYRFDYVDRTRAIKEQ